MEVIIDNRETKIKEYFSSQINYVDIFKYENLDIGDIVIKYNGEVKYIFERKTIRDLADSIKDNRYHEQKQRMKFSSSSDVKISYIFEYFINYDSLVPDIQISNLRGDIVLSAILNTTLRDNYGIFLTRNTDETIYIIENIIYRMLKDPSKYFIKTEKVDDTYLLKRRKKDNITRDNIFLLYLSQIPGVSKSIGTHLAKLYKTMSEFILYLNTIENYDDKINYIANISVDIKNDKKRKIGKKIASRIIEFLF
jgi:ERCC4-type nuclease